MKALKKQFSNLFNLVGGVIVLITSCDLTSNVEKQPEVVLSTLEVKDITQTRAVTGGNIAVSGSTTIEVRGVCWSTRETPTIDDKRTEDGSGIGSYTSEITGLESGVKYYVRSYANYDGGTIYGSTLSFVTSSFVTEIVDVTNPITGKTWMDRNLGASRAATSSLDVEAYGNLYQWGRGSDGHEKRNSETTDTLSTRNSPGHGKFIQSHWDEEYYDWRSPQNPNLWQGVNGVNNPCPPGYRLPTREEFMEEMNSWKSKDADGAFASPLKLTLAGIRNPDGSSPFVGRGRDGQYWSSTVGEGIGAESIFIENEIAGRGSSVRGFGFSVRCIKGN